MPVSTENIRRWIEQSDIDYITYFIKAWIPFNAWYSSRYEPLDGERPKINAIKNTQDDPVRRGINTYLEGDGQVSQEFRSYLAALHHALEQAGIDSREGRVSFREIIKEKNSTNLVDNETKRQITYFLRRVDGTRLGEITQMEVFLKDRAGSTFFNYRHTEYDWGHLQNMPTFTGLSPVQQENTRLYFESLHPIIITDAIETNLQEAPRNYYRCDSYIFKRDTNDNFCNGRIVVKGLIEVLYQLRNILFHGELTPNETVQPVYKNAYFLLKMLLEKVR
jgi:hypothetical protein